MPSFESGVRLFKNLLSGRGAKTFQARTDDPLHSAFPAKATVHSGPFGMPMLWGAARRFLEEKSYEARPGDTLVYTHIPFCERRCLFCMFYQNPWTAEASGEYCKRLEREFALWAGRPGQESSPVRAVYFGGGTPTALEPDDIRRVLAAVRRSLPLAEDCEITFEGRMHNMTPEKIEAALEGGVNRFSLGVQTFNDKIRSQMQRIDKGEDVARRLEEIARGPAAVVIDLIFGFPGQMGAAWDEDLRIASSLAIDGIDCYQLNVFEKSPLMRRIKAGLLPPAATLAEAADMYARSVEVFSEAPSWRQISNTHWARTARERNVYNSRAKTSIDCLPFGCGAGGKMGGHSWMQERSLAKWSTMIDKGEKPVFAMTRPTANWFLLRDIAGAVEKGSFNLRELGKAHGVDADTLLQPVTSQWIEAGLLTRDGDVLSPTTAGRFWCVTMAQLMTDSLGRSLSKGTDAAGMSMSEAANYLNGVPQSGKDAGRTGE